MRFPNSSPATQAITHLRSTTRTPMKRLGFLLLGLTLACNTDKFVDLQSSTGYHFVRLNPQAASIAVGQSQTVTVTAFDGAGCGATPCNPLTPGNPLAIGNPPTFRSLNPAVASVDGAGVVTGNAVGSTSIIATLQNEPGVTGGAAVTLADTTVFTVTAAPVPFESLTLSGRAGASPNTVAAGTTLALTRTTTDANGAPITGVGQPQWYSFRPEIATVSQTGVVTGVAPGNTTIIATISVNGVTRTTSFDVVVTPPVTATVNICGQVCQASPVTGIAFIPASTTVSATQAAVQGLPGATVNFVIPANTFTATTTPNNVDCFNVTFANPAGAGAVAPSTDAGNIGTGAAGTSNGPFCTGTRSRRFTTPGTYTFSSTTNGATGTIIVQ
jgi:hypothetical protein